MVDIRIVKYCSFIVEGRLTGLVTNGVRTAFCNALLKERYKGLRGRRRRFKQVLDDLKEERRHWKSDVWLTVHRNSVWIRKTN